MSVVTEYVISMGSTAILFVESTFLEVYALEYTLEMHGEVGWKKIALIFMNIHFVCLLYFIVNDITLLIIVKFVHGIGFGVSSNAIVTIASAILPKKRFCGHLVTL